MSPPSIVVVTGANRGIGLAIAQQIAAAHSHPNLRLYAASRAGSDLGIQPAHKGAQVLYPSLDISSKASIDALAKSIKDEHGRVDVLINNAGINVDAKYSPANAKLTLDVNYRGTLQMCETFLPLMPAHSRITNLSSVGSSLEHYSPAIAARFRDPNMTLADLAQLADEYQHAVTTHTEVPTGWGGTGRSYSVSKACVNALSAILARQPSDVLVNACCPGWVSTDMGRLVGRAPKRVEDGARIPLRLAFDDIGNVSGRYWANASIRSKELGRVMEW
ncbi:hypothetical protein LTR60_003033 [Cryomyces antarcticus]|nr:hypothetical protein LTR60_003033 [Cryomyces antarcticus]